MLKNMPAAALSAAVLLLCVSCAPSPAPAPSAPNEFYYTEAYITEALPKADAQPSPAPAAHQRLDAYPNTPARSEVSALPEKTRENVQTLSLVPVEYSSQTLFRINDTNWLTDDVNSYYDNTVAALTHTAERLKSIKKNNPDILLYNYFITRIRDCDWFGDDAVIFDYALLYQSLISDDVRFDRFKLPDFEYYMETGYKTDFHVNYKGSDVVYGDVYAMLSSDFVLSARKQPVRELDFDELRIVGDYINDETWNEHEFTKDEMDVFRAYEYDIEPYTSFVDDKQMVLGLAEEYAAGQIDRHPRAGHQFAYYGGQTGIVRFEFNQPDKPNLLMVSDSQGRPSRVCIASHFNTTVYIDNIQWLSPDVDVDKLIEDYDIDALLFIGQRSMFEAVRT